MADRVLIVTNRADLHADLVAPKLQARGGDPFRLNLDEFPAHFALGADFSAARWSGALTYLPTGEVLRFSEVRAVWLRKRADFSFASSDLAPQEHAYAQGEMEHILFSLLYLLDCYWMSHPMAVRGAGWKGEQLLRASRMGFQTPPSMVTNRRSCVERFREAVGGDIVFKSLSSPSLAADQVDPADRIAGSLPTTRIDAAHDDLLDAVETAPCFFQQHVPKDHELRVTVIGDRVFAARIHSQDDARTAVDYRDFSAGIAYEAARLPVEVERRCRSFVHSYGLTYGAVDLIVTPDGEYVFLENNPVGQFLFVEQLVPELDLSGALADCLIEGARACGS